ncbi:hypothetical protein K438DRAFT_1820254 [Mycena galopus ATCC 62051]|nr:hypothetical protein K438DRAFT_1820254 [Mycena galopus ATCC 62051]
MYTAPQAIPTSLIIPIIDGYVQGIRPAFAFILIPTVFGSMLVPLMILLFALSTPQTRRRPIFVLNALAIGLGIIVGALSTHLTIRSILLPFAGVNATENLTFTIFDVWLSWFAEAVLVVRIAAVFPRSKLPLLLAFPITVKAARVAVNIMFSVEWARRLLHAGTSNQFVILSELPRSFFKAAFFLELFDNSYMSSLFLWRLRLQTQSTFFDSSAIERVPSSNESYSSKLQRLFWIATTNFIFPLIFGVIEIITVFVGKDVILAASFEMVNTYVAIISTVFATIWSSTSSFKEAIGQNNSLASSRPVVFRMNRTRGTTDSGPVDDLNTHGVKPENWDGIPQNGAAEK